MNSDYPPTRSTRRTYSDDRHLTVGRSLGVALLSLAFLVALSYPFLTLAAVLGALTPRLLRRGRALLDELRTPSAPRVVAGDHRTRH